MLLNIAYRIVFFVMRPKNWFLNPFSEWKLTFWWHKLERERERERARARLLSILHKSDNLDRLTENWDEAHLIDWLLSFIYSSKISALLYYVVECCCWQPMKWYLHPIPTSPRILNSKSKMQHNLGQADSAQIKS